MIWHMCSSFAVFYPKMSADHPWPVAPSVSEMVCIQAVLGKRGYGLAELLGGTRVLLATPRGLAVNRLWCIQVPAAAGKHAGAFFREIGQAKALSFQCLDIF